MSDYGDMDINRLKQSIQKKVKDKMKPKPKDIIKTVIKAAVIKLGIILLPIVITYIFIASILDFLDGGSSAQASHGYGAYSGEYNSFGNPSPFGCTMEKSEFIQCAKNYYKNDNHKMVQLAPKFYDVCKEYDINPCFVFGTAVRESGSATSSAYKKTKNLFGFGHGNTDSQGKSYSDEADSIRDYCEWIISASTEGSSSYNSAMKRAEEFSEFNDKLKGTPKNNLYVLFCMYAWIGDTHIANETSFDSPAGLDYYKSQGSNWGTGGRYIIYYMATTEKLFDYKTFCGHPNGSDATSTAERAMYSSYFTDIGLKYAYQIFGDDCLVTGEGTGEGGSDSGDGSNVVFSSQGGVYTDKSNLRNQGIKGTFESNITKKKFYVYYQGVSGWGVWCNRAAAISLWSGYCVKNDKEALNLFAYAGSWGDVNQSQSEYNKHGMQYTQIGTGKYTNFKDDLRSALSNGKYGLFYINQPSYYGKSGTKWTSQAHWLAALGYQKVNGQEQIFISDSGRWERGGWTNINEFDTATNVQFRIVSPLK